MLIQIFKKQKELQARKKYKENISNINSLDDACNRLDDLKREMNKTYANYRDILEKLRVRFFGIGIQIFLYCFHVKCI